MPHRLLIVDDDVLLGTSLVEQLSLYEEFSCALVHQAQAGLQLVKSDGFDAVVLDVGLPDMDGREVCKLMRKNGYKGAILMLTGHDSEADEILGLEAGANDYITKPFKFSLFLARLRAHLRQHVQSDDAVFQIGAYSFRPSTKMLITENGTKIKLTEKETAILKFLYRAGDVAVSRDHLLQDVWGYHADVTTHTLETHIYRLRQKIEADPANATLLVTEANGYRLAL